MKRVIVISLLCCLLFTGCFVSGSQEPAEATSTEKTQIKQHLLSAGGLEEGLISLLTARSGADEVMLFEYSLNGEFDYLTVWLEPYHRGGKMDSISEDERLSIDLSPEDDVGRFILAVYGSFENPNWDMSLSKQNTGITEAGEGPGAQSTSIYGLELVPDAPITAASYSFSDETRYPQAGKELVIGALYYSTAADGTLDQYSARDFELEPELAEKNDYTVLVKCEFS